MRLLDPGAGSILVTGAAGFIGANVCRALIDRGCTVVGVDNINAYYDPSLKRSRLQSLEAAENFSFETLELADPQAVNAFFRKFQFSVVVHLAAQAGVRYSIENPDAYIKSNLFRFQNILENCRQSKPRHLVFASSIMAI